MTLRTFGLIICMMMIIFNPGKMFAQGETAVPFLLFSSSPDGNGMGGINASRITDDAMAELANPAQLGLQALHQFVSTGFYTSSTDWLPGFAQSNLTYTATAANAGLNLQRITAVPLPISVGIGYSRVNHDLGNFVTTDFNGQTSYFTAAEHSTNFTFGVGLDYIIKAGFGFTTKSVESDLAPFVVQGQGRKGEANFSTYDLGLITQIPLFDIYKRAGGTMPAIFSDFEPLIDLTFGYSRNNLGDKMVVYIDQAQGDPLPRTAVAGLNLKLGVVSHTLPDDWELISFMIGRQAEDILVRRFPAPTDSLGNVTGPPPPWQYVGGTGDIRFFNNLILGEWGGNIELRKGWQLNMFELFYLRGGSYLGSGGQDYTTDGLGFRLGGLLKFLQWISPEFASSQIMNFVERHFDVQYNKSEYHSRAPNSPLDGTQFKGMNIIVR